MPSDEVQAFVMCRIGLVAGWCMFGSGQAFAQQILVEDAPRPFTVVAPNSWVRAPTTTGSSRVKFAAPAGTPSAECAVLVKELHGLENQPQSYYDQQMLGPPNPGELASQLSSRYNNVSVFGPAVAFISGYPAQFANTQYSVGTPAGEQWARGISVSTATTPGLVWIVVCGAIGRTAEEAQKGFSYWQAEIMRFPTNVKIR